MTSYVFHVSLIFQEESLDRPVAGHTNICPEAIKNNVSIYDILLYVYLYIYIYLYNIPIIIVQERNIRSLESTLKHELLHAFGFSSSLFAFFRDETGEPRTPRLEDGKPPINLDLQVDE